MCSCVLTTKMKQTVYSHKFGERTKSGDVIWVNMQVWSFCKIIAEPWKIHQEVTLKQPLFIMWITLLFYYIGVLGNMFWIEKYCAVRIVFLAHTPLRVFGSVLKEIKYGAKNQAHRLNYYFLSKSQREAWFLEEKKKRNQKEKLKERLKGGFLLLESTSTYIVKQTKVWACHVFESAYLWKKNVGYTGNNEFTDRQRQFMLPADILASL